jgi:hypothetical protein
MTDPEGRITIVSDASLCVATRSAGWAGAVINPDGSFFVTSGPLTKRCGSANSAEAEAMAMAVQWAIGSGHVKDGDVVLLATDSHDLHRRLAGVHVSRRNKIRLRRGLPLPAHDTGASWGSPVKLVRNLADQHGLTVAACRIDGHPSARKRKGSLRARIMHRVNAMAGARMREQRALFIQGQYAQQSAMT